MPSIPRKLTAEDVAKIRALGRLGGLAPQRSIAAHFGLSQSTVSDILAGRKWAEPPPTAWRPHLIVHPDLETVLSRARRDGGRIAGPLGVSTLPPDPSLAAGDAEAVVDADDATAEPGEAA